MSLRVSKFDQEHMLELHNSFSGHGVVGAPRSPLSFATMSPTAARAVFAGDGAATEASSSTELQQQMEESNQFYFKLEQQLLQARARIRMEQIEQAACAGNQGTIKSRETISMTETNSSKTSDTSSSNCCPSWPWQLLTLVVILFACQVLQYEHVSTFSSEFFSSFDKWRYLRDMDRTEKKDLLVHPVGHSGKGARHKSKAREQNHPKDAAPKDHQESVTRRQQQSGLSKVIRPWWSKLREKRASKSKRGAVD